VKEVGTMSAHLRAHLEAECRRALHSAAEGIVADAQGLVPVETGHLRETISHGPVEGDRVEVKAAAEYAVYVEHGTRHMAAQPFLAPAAYRKRRIDG
jgi:HK97 gp10 family phage protein